MHQCFGLGILRHFLWQGLAQRHIAIFERVSEGGVELGEEIRLGRIAYIGAGAPFGKIHAYFAVTHLCKARHGARYTHFSVGIEILIGIIVATGVVEDAVFERCGLGAINQCAPCEAIIGWHQHAAICHVTTHIIGTVFKLLVIAGVGFKPGLHCVAIGMQADLIQGELA